jgi:cold shock protein
MSLRFDAGYGFIQPQGGSDGRDVFVHISAVERAGLSTLNEGQQVEYEIEENRGKTSAVNLKVKWVSGDVPAGRPPAGPEAEPVRSREQPHALAVALGEQRRYPALIAAAVTALGVRSCLIEREVIACDGAGLADFQLLSRRRLSRRPASQQTKPPSHARVVFGSPRKKVGLAGFTAKAQPPMGVADKTKLSTAVCAAVV